MTEAAQEIPLGMRELQPNPSTYIAQCLKEQGVEVAFGVHGGHIWQMVDEISNAGIKIITVRHEQAAVYAAEAYSKVTNKPGVAFATVGPGTGNTVSAVQQAFWSCSPVIVLLGGCEYEHDRTYTIQEAHADELMQSITKWTKRLVHPDQFKHFITRAFKDAQAYPKGPVALEFSMSAFFTPIPPRGAPTMFGEHVCYVENWRGEDTGKPIPVAGAPELVEKAVKLIFQAEKPVMFAADGLHWSEGWDELREFVELAQVPVTNRRIARGAMPEDHPLYFSSRIVRQALSGCDLLVALGMKVGAFDGYGAGWPQTIQINESPEHLWTFIKTPVAIVGSPKLVLRQMIDYIKANNLKPPPGRAERANELQEAQRQTLEGMKAKAEKYKDHKPVHFGYLAKVLWDVAEDLCGGKNRVVIDGYTISDYAPPFIRARYSGQVMDASEQAGVGHGVGMAIGAAIADPEAKKQPVIALMGDAGVGLAGMDIETAARYKLPIVYLVTNNNGWLTSMRYTHYGKNWEALGPQDREMGEECLPDIRYDKVFEEMGCHGEWVTDPAEIRSALERAFKAAQGGKTAVVNVQMDPTIGNRQTYTPGYTNCWSHIPWDRLAKRGKALRRMLPIFPWDELGIPAMPIPDPWEPVREEEMMP